MAIINISSEYSGFVSGTTSTPLGWQFKDQIGDIWPSDQIGDTQVSVKDAFRYDPLDWTSLAGWLLYKDNCWDIKMVKNAKANDSIKKVVFNDPATIVFWKDGTKTVVKCQNGEKYDKEKGIALCFMKKIFGNKGNFNDIFRKYIVEDEKE